MDLCQRTKELWAAYLAKCNEENLSGLNHFAPACSVIGTGKHEIYRDLDQFTQAMNKDIQTRGDFLFHFRDFWCTEQPLSEECSLVYGGLYIWGDSTDNSIRINVDSRFTILYKKIDGEWKVLHLHQSIPNPEQMDGEYYPRTLTQQIERSQETIEHLTQLAQRDSLTGLINFNTLQSFYTDLDKHDAWLIVVDMDDFKTINDTHGHLAGNHMLQRLSDLLMATVRSHDLVCRMGGDEFVLLCCGLGSERNAQELMQRLLARTAEVSGEEPAWTGISIGGTPIYSDDCLESAFKRADKALYQAKAQGKNQGSIL